MNNDRFIKIVTEDIMETLKNGMLDDLEVMRILEYHLMQEEKRSKGGVK